MEEWKAVSKCFAVPVACIRRENMLVCYLDFPSPVNSKHEDPLCLEQLHSEKQQSWSIQKLTPFLKTGLFLVSTLDSVRSRLHLIRWGSVMTGTFARVVSTFKMSVRTCLSILGHAASCTFMLNFTSNACIPIPLHSSGKPLQMERTIRFWSYSHLCGGRSPLLPVIIITDIFLPVLWGLGGWLKSAGTLVFQGEASCQCPGAWVSTKFTIGVSK